MKSILKCLNNWSTTVFLQGAKNVLNCRKSWVEAMDVENMITSLQLLHLASSLIFWWKKPDVHFCAHSDLNLSSQTVKDEGVLCTSTPNFSLSYWWEILKCCLGAYRWSGRVRVGNPMEGYQNYKGSVIAESERSISESVGDEN